MQIWHVNLLYFVLHIVWNPNPFVGGVMNGANSSDLK